MDVKVQDKGRRTKEFQDFFTTKDVTDKFFETYKVEIDKIYEIKQKRLKLIEPAVGSGNLIWSILEYSVPVDIKCMDIQLDYLEFVQKTAIKKGYNTYIKNGILHIQN